MASPRTRRSTAALVASLAVGLVLTGCGAAAPGAGAAVEAVTVQAAPRMAPVAAATARPEAPRALALHVEGDAVVATWEAPDGPGAVMTGYELFVDDAPAVVLDAAARSSRLAGVVPGDGVLVQLRAVAGDLPGRTAEASLERTYRTPAPRWALEEERAIAAAAAAASAAVPAPAAAPAAVPASARVAEERAAAPAPAPASSPAAPDWAALYRAVEGSVVQVSREGCTPGDASTGTAFFVGPDLLVTAAHVVEDAASLGVVVGGRDETAEVVGLDVAQDVALLRVPTQHPGLALPLAAELPPVGTPHALVGFASGLGQSLQLGTVSSVLPAFAGVGGAALTDAVQSDVQTSPGASGGPWLLADGTVVALTSTGVDTNVTVGAGAPTAAALVDAWSRAPQVVTAC
ncbi:serine protease [Pseudokineococcus marinus]|uniref:Trypsin-like peptidase domain-containing protein n=1 Tax=Pseudokineococcus marinus TaxID=351215 RepID=A0A849BN39_9ACTN|nr:serine protease [Pseudokineococcus marinus]NNH22212.1 trypsin-like peptidase domain-containing protein [Pseudokineococcus marinus]